jgi:nucleotide-binding universal stress UspA family protein
MNQKKIVVPVDFTAASEQAVKQAIVIAKKTNTSILLLHCMESRSAEKKVNDQKLVEENLNLLTKRIESEGLECGHIIADGSIFDQIPAIANRPDNYMMVIGTHGIQGIKQKMMGADILRIVRKVYIPCLIVQEECITNYSSPVVLPVGGHQNFKRLAELTADYALKTGAEIHIFSVNKKGNPISENIRQNTAHAKEIFTNKSVPFKYHNEDAYVISVGYAKQTLKYANLIGAGLVSVMSVNSDEHYYFAQSDKETMINNEYNIPVFCVSGIDAE